MKIILAILFVIVSPPFIKAVIIETFNTGLAHGYNLHTKERIPHLLKALKESKADILCLQEVWYKKDRDIFTKTLAEKFPYIFYAPIEQKRIKRPPACRPRDLFGEGGFVRCMWAECSNAKGAEFTSCIMNSCDESLKELKKTNPQCASALFSKAGKNPVFAILALLNPFSQTGLLAHGGSNGLMLFSKLALTSQSVFQMDTLSTLMRRDALVAEVKINSVPAKIYCTHLTTDLDIPYTGEHTSWREEHKAQVLHLTNTTRQEQRAILLGDFNCSPILKGIDPKFGDSCALFDRSFRRAVPKIPVCTFCSETEDLFIDHIYTKGLRVQSVKRVYDDSTIFLSDHYGLQAQISLEKIP